MNLHEYQAKQLFADFGMPVSPGIAAGTAAEAVAAAGELGGSRWVCKVQVHAGGRGKAGGVKIAESLDDVRDFALRWLGKRLVTVQTDARGQPVGKIYVEACADIARELYLGAVIDRASRRVVVMASSEGGVEIEQVAAETPEKILRATIDPYVGAQPHQGRQTAYSLGLEGAQVREFTDLFLNLMRMFHALDCSLVEINPLVITGEGRIHCLDAKVNIDNNALYRQPKLRALRDASQEDARGGAGRCVRSQLRRPRRQHRLHGQRRGAGDGHDGPREALRRQSGELPRCRRRRDEGGRERSVSHHPVGQQRQGRGSSTSSAASCRARSSPTASSARSPKWAWMCPWWSASRATTRGWGRSGSRTAAST